jgi:ATP-dependent RNA helicase DeaD
MQGDQREVSERVTKQVERIMEAGLVERALTKLIISVRRATGEPREVTPLLPEAPRGPRGRERGPERSGRFEREPRFERDQRFEHRDSQPPRFEHRDSQPPRFEPRDSRPPRFAPRDGGERQGGDWVPFRVSWGEAHGADARRLVAMLCRRGNIRGSDIGQIRVSRVSSTVEVAGAVAQSFAEATREPDPRDPRVIVTPLGEGGPAEPARRERPTAPQRPRPHVPPSKHRAPRDDGPPPRAPRADGPPSRAPRDDGPPPRAPRANAPVPHRGPHRVPHAAAASDERMPARDVPPKRPARKVVVTAPPPRRPKPKR